MAPLRSKTSETATTTNNPILQSSFHRFSLQHVSSFSFSNLQLSKVHISSRQRGVVGLHLEFSIVCCSIFTLWVAVVSFFLRVRPPHQLDTKSRSSEYQICSCTRQAQYYFSSAIRTKYGCDCLGFFSYIPFFTRTPYLRNFIVV